MVKSSDKRKNDYAGETLAVKSSIICSSGSRGGGAHSGFSLSRTFNVKPLIFFYLYPDKNYNTIFSCSYFFTTS
ncbi:hypothetical protein D770_14700 [Flammeovirgaceae bacterium 311]|nr:hypothetical protein D770_14700 [Flammeovirgaceae bacterium 311]